ncbi:MAG: DUF4279 domain-containing protein [Actinomycetota bacterium]
MKIRQYAHFDIASDLYDPDAITAALLIEPTTVSWKESKSTEPPIPRSHLWQYRATGDGCVDDLVRELLGVFLPLRSSIEGLTADGACRVEIRFMRSFGDSEGEEEDEGPDDLPDNLVRIPGQHQLLGFHLDTGLMAQLVSLGCSLDFDEYG